MIVHGCTVVNSVLYVTALVVLIVYSCLKTTTKNIIIYERIIAVLKNESTVYLDVIKYFNCIIRAPKSDLIFVQRSGSAGLVLLCDPPPVWPCGQVHEPDVQDKMGWPHTHSFLGGRTVNIILSRSKYSLRA